MIADRWFSILRAVAISAVGLAFLLSVTTSRSAEREPAVRQEPAVELPPMIVMESSKAPPWLYVAAGDTEYLSRCSPGTTRAFVTAQLQARQLMLALIPAEFLMSTVVPTVSVLAPLELKAASDDAIMREMIRSEEQLIREASGVSRNAQPIPAASRVQFLPNLRLNDRDMSAVFSYVNEAEFVGERLVLSREQIYYLLSRRTPTLPQWLVEGVTRVYDQADLRVAPITLPPFTWVSREETSALQRDSDSRRALLPASELFAPDALNNSRNRHPVRAGIWRAQVALFVRWALDPINEPAQDKFWTFASRVSEQPVSEELFFECFGFGYADLRDRLSDYLPVAVKEPVRILPGKLPDSPRFEVRPATPAEVSRLRGEWERLEISFVRDKYPEFVSRYAEQARTTLRKPVGRGDRDPQLLAALGLCEIDAGDASAGRAWLEQAMAGGVGRPRVYYEVARLRWEEMTRERPETRGFTVGQLLPVLEPLRKAMTQTPPLPEVFMLMADAWLRCGEPAEPADVSQLINAARLFRRIPGVAFRVALLQIKHRRFSDALNLLTLNVEFLSDPASRKQYAELQTILAGAKH